MQTKRQYDTANIFAKIIRKEIPCDLLTESKHTIVLNDKYPKAPTHVLIIPKGPYMSASHFYQQASSEEIMDLSRLLGELPKQLGIDKNGFRLISNEGDHGGQEIDHFHMHLLGGMKLNDKL